MLTMSVNDAASVASGASETEARPASISLKNWSRLLALRACLLVVVILGKYCHAQCMGSVAAASSQCSRVMLPVTAGCQDGSSPFCSWLKL